MNIGFFLVVVTYKETSSSKVKSDGELKALFLERRSERSSTTPIVDCRLKS